MIAPTASGVPAAGEADALLRHQAALRACRSCPAMHGPPVHGTAVYSPVFLLGQAPGTKEIEQRRPFCWTAGRTLFRWFAPLGLDEENFRARVYMSAVCRCFPGKNPKGGDRVPDAEEIARCARWWQGEIAVLRPRLILAVGKLAIARFLPVSRLEQVVGECWPYRYPGGVAEVIPLPHPSGASTWFKMMPGKMLLERALLRISAHPAWQTLATSPAVSLTASTQFHSGDQTSL